MHPILKIVLSVVGAILIFVGKDPVSANSFYGPFCLYDKDSIATSQSIGFYLGLLITAVIFPIQQIQTDKTLKKVQKENTDFLKSQGKGLYTSLKARIGDSADSLNARIFIPKKGVLSWIHCNIGMRLPYFKNLPRFITLVHFPGLSVEHEHSLRFEISPSQEGIVGKVFNTGDILIDANLGDANTYNLNTRKQMQLGNIRFCAAVPIVEDVSISGRRKGLGKVLAVLSFDGEKEIDLDTEEKVKAFKSFMYLYASFVGKHQKF